SVWRRISAPGFSRNACAACAAAIGTSTGDRHLCVLAKTHHHGGDVRSMTVVGTTPRRPMLAMVLIGLGATGILFPVYLGQGLPWRHAAAAALMVAVPGVVLGGCAWRFARRRRDDAEPTRALLVDGTAALAFALA